MVSHRVALLLLAVAARRWPAELREDLRREWTAELHTLAADRQHLGMLRFAASLAARRSGIEAADRLARRAPSGGWRVVAGVVTPLALTVLALWYAMRQDVNEVAVAAPGLVLWLAGLALVLRAAVALAERGRVRAAWWVGLLSAFVVADAAVVLTVLGAIPTGPETVLDGLPQGDTVNPVSAPMWLSSPGPTRRLACLDPRVRRYSGSPTWCCRCRSSTWPPHRTRWPGRSGRLGRDPRLVPSSRSRRTDVRRCVKPRWAGGIRRREREPGAGVACRRASA